jgi:hypothetical protein
MDRHMATRECDGVCVCGYTVEILCVSFGRYRSRIHNGTIAVRMKDQVLSKVLNIVLMIISIESLSLLVFELRAPKSRI